jgi:hypothetical protein
LLSIQTIYKLTVIYKLTDRNRMGGGVAIYFRDNINIKNRNELVPDCLEALCVEVRKPKSKPILIVSCYRPPNSNHEVLKIN